MSLRQRLAWYEARQALRDVVPPAATNPERTSKLPEVVVGAFVPGVDASEPSQQLAASEPTAAKRATPVEDMPERVEADSPPRLHKGFSATLLAGLELSATATEAGVEAGVEAGFDVGKEASARNNDRLRNGRIGGYQLRANGPVGVWRPQSRTRSEAPQVAREPNVAPSAALPSPPAISRQLDASAQSDVENLAALHRERLATWSRRRNETS